MEALHDTVRCGKVRYLPRASTMYTWQVREDDQVAAVNGWTPFVNTAVASTTCLASPRAKSGDAPLLLASGIGPFTTLLSPARRRPLLHSAVDERRILFATSLRARAAPRAPRTTSTRNTTAMTLIARSRGACAKSPRAGA